jgi:ParB/RepB/Spo0J family partition protein
MTAAKGGLTVGIADINVGIRHRRDLGDIEGLAASIADVGLLHPVVINIHNKLIAGARRLKACRQLGWSSVPVHVVDIDAIARGELAENEHRKNFTPSELVAIAETVEQRERELARERMTLGKISTGSERGKVRDRIAAPLGVSGRTLEKAKAVVEAAEAEPDNEKIAKLVEAMDKSGRVNGPYRRLQNMKQAEAIRAEPPPLPNKGPYRAAMVDVAWAYEPDDDDAAERGVLPYSTMSIEQACALDVDSIMHEGSVLGFWVTNFILVKGLHLPVLRAWGFEPKTNVTWPKERIGRGHYAKGQTEHLIIATRGKPIVTLSDQTTLLQGPFHLVNKGEHSSKPVEAYTFFESLFPAPRYADLFSRYRHNDRWDCHGYEAPTDESDTITAQMDAL